MPWATPSHTRGPPESPCGQREQELSSSSSGLVSPPPWDGWSLLGVLADIRVLLVLRFHPGFDNPAGLSAGSLCPYMTVGQCSPPRDTGQRPDRRTGWDTETGFVPTAPHLHSSAGPRVLHEQHWGSHQEKILPLVWISSTYLRDGDVVSEVSDTSLLTLDFKVYLL